MSICTHRSDRTPWGTGPKMGDGTGERMVDNTETGRGTGSREETCPKLEGGGSESRSAVEEVPGKDWSKVGGLRIRVKD